MKSEPRGLTATFVVTKTYYVTCSGATEEDCWAEAENLDLSKLSDDDFVDADINIKDGFEYDSF